MIEQGLLAKARRQVEDSGDAARPVPSGVRTSVQAEHRDWATAQALAGIQAVAEAGAVKAAEVAVAGRKKPEPTTGGHGLQPARPTPRRVVGPA